MSTVFEIMEKCNTKITVDYLKSKYEYILELFNEHRDEIDKDENIGVLLKKTLKIQCNNEITTNDHRELIKNVFCRALLEKIKIFAYRSIEP
jgi:predicted metallopeptidase